MAIKHPLKLCSMHTIKYKFLFFLTAFITLLSSCKKEDDFNNEFDLPRQFKPGNIQINAGQTDVKLRWNPSLFTQQKGVTYTVQVAKDSLFAGTIDYTAVVDTAYIQITDSVLQVMQYYYSRVKANANGPTAESGWVVSDKFRITGEQIFLPVADADIKDTSVILKWTPTAGLTTISIKPTGGAATVINLSAADVAANQKKINGLTPLTNYTAEIYKGTTLKGTISFTTKELNIYAVVLNPGDDLVTAVTTAANGDIIGLNPGTYNTMSAGVYVNLVVAQKTITIQSTSGNPGNTKVNFKEITVKGTGAGITVKGIEFDGTAGLADYFINFVGMATDAEAATFTNVNIDNCRIRFTRNCLMRGNRAANNAHKINTIRMNNSIAWENGTGSYHYFMLDKMEFQKLELTNNTMYDLARAFISYATNITVSPTPLIVVTNNTINSFGFAGRNYILLDANANVVNATFRDNIIANTPKAETVGTIALRTATTATVLFQYNNTFNFNGGPPLVPLTFPAQVQLSNNLNIDLGWTTTTSSFTLPAGSPLRTASSTGGPVGDPRWAQ
jgi:hypothetical protein